MTTASVTLQDCQYLSGATYEDQQLVREPGARVAIVLNEWGVSAFKDERPFLQLSRDELLGIDIGGLTEPVHKRSRLTGWPQWERWATLIIKSKHSSEPVLFKVEGLLVGDLQEQVHLAVAAMNL